MEGGSSSGGDAGSEGEECSGPAESDTVVVDGFSIVASRGEVELAAQLADRLLPRGAPEGSARLARAADVECREGSEAEDRQGETARAAADIHSTKSEEAVSAAESTDDDCSLVKGDGLGCCGHEVVGREGAAAVKRESTTKTKCCGSFCRALKQPTKEKMTACVDLLSSEEKEEESAFDKSTDLILSLNDEAYGSVVRPHFQQLWEDRSGGGETPRDRSKGIFDVFRKKLKSTGGSFYKARDPSLKGESFYDHSNVYLVEDEDEVVRSKSQCNTATTRINCQF